MRLYLFFHFQTSYFHENIWCLVEYHECYWRGTKDSGDKKNSFEFYRAVRSFREKLGKTEKKLLLMSFYFNACMNVKIQRTMIKI